LDRLREELGRRNYLPILFDFEKLKSHDAVSTVRTLAGISKFVIADLTEAKSVLEGQRRLSLSTLLFLFDLLY
jgi:hypothetical protein